MANMKKRKGQAALEAAFVVVFIVIAINAIFHDVIGYSSDIILMSKARMEAQGLAMGLTLNGTPTYLVRIDLDTGSAHPYVVSESCTGLKAKFANALGYPPASFNWDCNDTIIYDY